jgi:hypothetical protein
MRDFQDYLSDSCGRVMSHMIAASDHLETFSAMLLLVEDDAARGPYDGCSISRPIVVQ